MVQASNLLPSELKSLIVELSSGSPSSLAALALTHTSYQRDAERALYANLSIFASSDESLKCMETLATNPEKAALVCFLTVEYTRSEYDNNRKVTTYLSKSLINMHSLSDFRVRSRPGEEGQTKGLGKILCEGHFRLHTFYCHDHFLNISEIIKSQTELQILGLYTDENQKIIRKTLKELHDAELSPPIIFTLEVESFLPYPDHICIFPTFYSVDRRATIPQVLAQSLFKDHGNYLVTRGEDIYKLSIYLADSSDMPSISEFSRNMAVRFPQIRYLHFVFERPCEIRGTEELKEEFSFFSNLSGVNVWW